MFDQYQEAAGIWKSESWILCHGICGNTWILKRTRKIVEQIVGKEEVIDITERREKNITFTTGKFESWINEWVWRYFIVFTSKRIKRMICLWSQTKLLKVKAFVFQ